MKKIYISENWTLENDKVGKLRSTVPGCVHTDLMNNGKITDIFWRDNNKDCQWIESCNWDYSCIFDAPKGEKVSLVFEGLDTYAEITLNGVKLGETDNMFVPHRFDVSDVLLEKENKLEVHFRSPIKEIEGRPEMRGAFTTERVHTRRMQCTYGWDWVDRFVTCGIYRPVYLEYGNGVDVEDVYIYTESVDGYSAQLYVEMNFKNFEKGSIAHVEILSPDGAVAAHTDFYANVKTFVRYFDIREPQLWYPNGYGEQPLYKLKITVGENTFEETFGIRTLKILQLADEEASEYRQKALEIKNSEVGKIFSHNDETSGFQVTVNGKRIFCKGGNWVPCEPFPSAEADEKIRYLVSAARDMGCNVLRAWGGGVFEKKAFYDECDRCGILVIQDFLMACGHYPEKEQRFIGAIAREAEFAVKYLRNHPCLAWWQGDNENAMWENELMEDYNGRDCALIASGPQVYKYDKFRQFLPSSPYGGDFYGSLTKGTSHVTNYICDIFNYFNNNDCIDYKEFFEQYTARFSCEDGTFGAVCRSSMLKFMTHDDLINDIEQEMIFYHSRSNPALKRHLLCDVISFARKVLGEFIDGEDRYFKYKYIQYEWVRVVFENVRRNLGYSNGILFWMYNDCWPAAMGWSFVDYYGVPKASYYIFKRCAKHLVGSLKSGNGSYTLTLSSDTEINKAVTVNAYMLEKGSVIKTYSTVAQILNYGTVNVDIPWQAENGKLVVCDIKHSEENDRCFYKEGALDIVPCDESIRIMAKSKDSITLMATSYIHAVELEGEFIFDDNYFSMMPDEIRIIHFDEVANCTENKDISVKAYTVK